MDADASVNMVAFEVRVAGKLQTLVGRGPTRCGNTIALAWETLAAEGGIQPDEVRQVYSEWEPSIQDQAFLDSTFPGVPVTYSFARPGDDDEAQWEAAMRQASATMERSVRKKWWQFWR